MSRSRLRLRFFDFNLRDAKSTQINSKLHHIKKIAITAGDINGIGPEIIRKAVSRAEFRGVEFTIFGPETALRKCFKSLKIEICDCGPKGISVEYGEISAEAGEASVRAIKCALEKTVMGEFHALVTAPISKKAVNMVGYNYIGHTEMLREWCSVEDVLMMFLSQKMVVGLMTAHIALSEVSRSLSVPLAMNKIRLLHQELRSRFGIAKPKIALCAVNPHAGEGGMFGAEEKEILTPAAHQARSEGINITDPLPADTLFPRADEYSAVLAVYHDQGLIPAKSVPGGSVNYTGGLPIIRTSPDHGTAFDIAGKDAADPSGMVNAIRWAVKLCR